MSGDKELSIVELAEAAQVPVRTVRYYITEGILESPTGRGRSATYSGEHLLRLRVVRTLAAQRVPLEEIKAVLTPLSKRELEELLLRSERQECDESRAKDTSPKAYVSTLLERAVRTDSRISPEVRESPESTFSPQSSGGEAWQRYTVTSGVELHVSSAASKRHRELVKKILQEFRRNE